MKILVIGKSTRAIVCSAKRAGHIVYALDSYIDIDTLKCADKVDLLSNKIPEILDIDAVVLGTGFENLKFKNTLNNPYSVAQKLSDKLNISKTFNSMNILHPETTNIQNASKLKFPIMVKPRHGSGGVRNVMLKNEDELLNFIERPDSKEFIAQEFINGIQCSASLISNGNESVVIALNEQLIGTSWLTKLPFAYCGNITPFYTEFGKLMEEYSKQIALEFKLLGSNGVDFIISEKGLYVIEVNGRFQGSIDTVELSTGINLFDAHLKAFSGELIKPKKPLCFAGKGILFSDKKITISQNFSDILVNSKIAADIPKPETSILENEPITTLLATGLCRNEVFDKIKKASDDFKNIVMP